MYSVFGKVERTNADVLRGESIGEAAHEKRDSLY